MTTPVAEVSTSKVTETAESPPKGKFQRFCDWIKDHKKEIAIALLIVGIAGLTFGTSAILGVVLSKGIGFIYNLFTLDQANILITGLSTIGKVFFAGVGCLMGGAALTGFGSGMLSGASQKTKL